MKFVFIAGAPRSGTSLTCQVLSALGLGFGTGLARADQYNRGGYWESARLRRVCRTWLRRIEADPMGQWPLPPRRWRPTGAQAASFQGDALHVLGDIAAHKDAKILPLWPLFREAFSDARWVAVRRNPEEVASSCMRARFMHRFRTLREWITWAEQMQLRVDDLVEATGAVEVWPDPAEPESFHGAADALGLEWQSDAVAAILKPSWWSAT